MDLWNVPGFYNGLYLPRCLMESTVIPSHSQTWSSFNLCVLFLNFSLPEGLDLQLKCN